MGWAYDQTGLKPVTKAVLVAIGNIADEEGYCWPSMKRIARMVEISVRSAQRHVQVLEQQGYLTVERDRLRDSGAATSNAYRLPMEARQLPLLLAPESRDTPHDKLTQGGDRAARGAGDTAARGAGDNRVTPYELPLEPSLERSATKKAKPAFELPDWVPTEAWESFKAMRKAQRVPITEEAARLLVRELDKLRAQGHAPGAVLEQSVMRGWRGVFEIKSQGARAAASQADVSAEAVRMIEGGAP